VTGEAGYKDNVIVLKTVFLIGAVADGVIAIEWFLISLGLADLPVHPSFFVGSGQDFLITAVMLFIAIFSDYVIFAHLFSAQQVMLGTSVKLALVIMFSGSYWYSKRRHG
jgi:hypothetical protein